MPFGKKSQAPVPKAFMTKTHGGLGNHKTVLHSHGAVRASGSLKGAPTNQPSSANRSTGHSTLK